MKPTFVSTVYSLRASSKNKYPAVDLHAEAKPSGGVWLSSVYLTRELTDARRASKETDTQTIQQLWFCGAHSDVGGGYPAGDWGLPDIALIWPSYRPKNLRTYFKRIGDPRQSQ